MNSRSIVLSSAGLLIALAVIVGCSDQNGAQPSANGSQASDDWKTGLDDKVVAALSQLSDADRTAALAQKTCPVTEKLLGSMDKPLKVSIAGQDVFLCCAGCESTIKSDPDKYLAKLKGN